MTKRKTGVAGSGVAGKNFVLSSTDLVEAFQEVAERFMSDIFELEPGDYIITDESDVRDFTPFGIPDTDSIWAQIKNAYGIDHDEVGSDRLVRIFRVIAERRRVQ